MRDLPATWKVCLLDEVIAVLKNGLVARQNKDGVGLPLSRIETIADGIIDVQRIGYAPDIKPEDAQDFLLEKDDILFSHINSPAHLGKTAIYQGKPEVLYHGMNLLLIRARTDVVNSHYLEYGIRYLRATGVFSLIAQHAVNQASINQKKLRNLEFPLAPLNEQERIAEKLDSLLARVDSCQSHLDRIPQILKHFRQSVLAAATSGRLTEDWREERELSIDDWDTKTGNEIFPFITSGSRWWAKYYSDSGSIFIRVGNLDHDTIELDWSNIQYVTPPDDAESKRTRVQIGDILISITADVGMVGYVRKDIGDAYTNQHVCIARQAGEYNGEFLAYYLTSPVGGLRQLTKVQRGATKAGLTLGDIRNLNFQIPSEEEQAEIVRRIEKLFAYAERIEAHYLSASERVGRLTPSLLAKAFRGELVEQDPEDEPGSVLLERIRLRPEVNDFKNKTIEKPIELYDLVRKIEDTMLKRSEIQADHLAAILKERGALTAEALWSASQLEIDDFYDQLKDEEANKLLREIRSENEDSPRLLEAL